MTSTALLVMDVQQGIVDRFAGDDGYLPRPAAPAGRRRQHRRLDREPGYDCGWLMLTSQATPNWSTHMPNSSPHTCFCIGMVTVPPAQSLSQ